MNRETVENATAALNHFSKTLAPLAAIIEKFAKAYARAITASIEEFRKTGRRMPGSNKTKRLRKKRAAFISAITVPHLRMEDKDDSGNVTMADFKHLPRK